MNTKWLTDLCACPEAVAWARAQKGTRQQAWNRCNRADWMLWLAARLCGERGSKQHRAVVLAACACARTALPHVPAGESRPLAAIELAERWARGDDTVTVGMLCGARAALTRGRPATASRPPDCPAITPPAASHSACAPTLRLPRTRRCQ